MAGDDFEAWVAPHWSAMQRLVARLAPGPDRDDLLQEALLQAWRKRHTFDESKGAARTWLLTVTADRVRRSRRSVSPSVVALGDWDAPMDMAGTDPDLSRAVRRLTGRQRMAIELYYYVGLPVADVAVLMNCSDGTVKATLSAARTRLRGVLAGGPQPREGKRG